MLNSFVRSAWSASMTDVAQAMLVTAWNMAIAGGGIVGGIVLERMGVLAFSPVLLVLLLATWLVVVGARHHGFA